VSDSELEATGYHQHRRHTDGSKSLGERLHDLERDMEKLKMAVAELKTKMSIYVGLAVFIGMAVWKIVEHTIKF
jgi:hypothetical protein